MTSSASIPGKSSILISDLSHLSDLLDPGSCAMMTRVHGVCNWGCLSAIQGDFDCPNMEIGWVGGNKGNDAQLWPQIAAGWLWFQVVATVLPQLQPLLPNPGPLSHLQIHPHPHSIGQLPPPLPTPTLLLSVWVGDVMLFIPSLSTLLWWCRILIQLPYLRAGFLVTVVGLLLCVHTLSLLWLC